MAFGLVAAVATVLLWTSTPRAVGDGDEYIVTAARIAKLQWPSFSRAEVEQLNEGIKWVEIRPGRLETVHFWFYPALAAPLVMLSGPLQFSQPRAFAILNVGIYAAVAVVALRTVSVGASLLIVLSPILWWLDKPHPEVFTFALLALTVLLIRSRPAIALVCVALAATQNPPIAALIPLILVIYPAARTYPLAVGVAVAVSALHPLYYLWNIGRATALLDGDIRVPPVMRYGAVVWDLNIGLLANAPFFGAALLVALVSAWRGWTSRRDTALASAAAAWLLFAFTQAVNLNHGGTPSMSRYALWLLPLAFPFLPAAGEPMGRHAVRVLRACIAASIVWSTVFFHPGRPEGHLEPTRLAMLQWTKFPAWQNPVPEIFAERLRGRDAVNELAATPGCEKVLIQAGAWPHPCPAQPLPERCQRPDTWCYGNRKDSGYDFVQVPRRGGFRLTWPPEKGR